MKAEINGNTSIFSELLNATGKKGFSEFASAMGDIANKNPELFGQMNDEDVKDIVSSLNEDPEKTTEIIQKFADQGENVTKEEFMNALKPSALMGKIKNVLEEAKKFEGKNTLTQDEKGEAKKLFEELKDLSAQLTELIKQAKKSK